MSSKVSAALPDVAALPKSPRPGRPRDPAISKRVMKAALHLYAREGWSGFVFDAVARKAKVGKPALYRRWNSAQHLLVDTLNAVDFPVARDCGSFRADLLDLGTQWVHWYSDRDRGLTIQRLYPDCLVNPELRDLYDTFVMGPRAEAARAITRRAMDRGEIDNDVPTSLVAELLLGALQIHYSVTPPEKLDRLAATFMSHVEHLVDTIVQGATGAPSASVPN